MAYDYDRRNEASLRGKIIRLAHAKPELREHLLPLLAKAKRVAIKLPNEGKDNSWGAGYFPLPPSLHHLGRFVDALKQPVDHKVWPKHGTHMLTVPVTTSFSVMAADMRSLLRLGLARIQSNQNGQVSFYFEGYPVEGW